MLDMDMDDDGTISREEARAAIAKLRCVDIDAVAEVRKVPGLKTSSPVCVFVSSQDDPEVLYLSTTSTGAEMRVSDVLRLVIGRDSVSGEAQRESRREFRRSTMGPAR